MEETGQEVGREAGISPGRGRRWACSAGSWEPSTAWEARSSRSWSKGRRGWSMGPYPAFFATPRLRVFDAYMASALVIGIGFLIAALVLARVSRYPRTDAGGALIGGLVLALTSGAILFTRLLAIIRAG